MIEIKSTIRKHERYTVVPNYLIENKEISARAVGVMAYLLSKPEGWAFYVSEIAENYLEQTRAIRTALRELEKWSYISIEKLKDENGQFYYDWTLLPLSNEEYTKKELLEIVKDVTPKKSGPQRFTKPTPELVQEYCKERKNGIDAEAFCDFYESKGWKVGSSPMKDWKCSVRTWERSGFGSGKKEQSVPIKKPMGL